MHLLSAQSTGPHEYIQQHTEQANGGRPVLCFEYRRSSTLIFKLSFHTPKLSVYTTPCDFSHSSMYFSCNRTIVPECKLSCHDMTISCTDISNTDQKGFCIMHWILLLIQASSAYQNWLTSFSFPIAATDNVQVLAQRLQRLLQSPTACVHTRIKAYQTVQNSTNSGAELRLCFYRRKKNLMFAESDLIGCLDLRWEAGVSGWSRKAGRARGGTWREPRAMRVSKAHLCLINLCVSVSLWGRRCRITLISGACNGTHSCYNM